MAVEKRRRRWRRGLLIFGGSIAVLLTIGLILVAVYKKEIIVFINGELKAALHTEAHIGDADVTFLADFPNITLRLKDVAIGMDSISGKEVVRARRVDLNLRTFKLVMSRIEFRSIKIHDANIFIFTTAGGFSNLDIFKKGKPDTTVVVTPDTLPISKQRPLPFEKQHLVLENVHFALYDSVKEKYYDLTLRKVDSHLVNKDTVVDITLKGPVDFGKLEFNSAKGALLRNVTVDLDVKTTLHRDSSLLEILPSKVVAVDANVAVSGSLKFRGNKRMRLQFTTKSIDYALGLRILPDTLGKKLSRLSMDKPVEVDFILDSPMIPGVKPSIDVHFILRNTTVTGKYVAIDKMSVIGHMTNHVDETLPYDNANTLIHLRDMEGEVDGLPIKAEIKLYDPSDLRLDLHAIQTFDLVQLNKQADTTALRFIGGNLSSEFRYQGKLKEYLDPTTTKYSGKLDGKMFIKDGQFRVESRKLDFSNLHADVKFNQDTVHVNSFGLRSGKSAVEITGTLINYVPLFLQPGEKGLVRLNIKSSHMDLGTLLAKREKRKSASKTATQKKKVSDMLDIAFKSLQFDIRFNVNEFKNKSFMGTKLTGAVRMKGTSLDVKDVRMDFARGELKLNASMKELHKSVNPVEVRASMKNVHFKELFNAFNNFGQKTITDDNIEGSVSMDTRLKVSINDDLNVILPTLNGDVNVTIYNGRLVNVQPLQKMSNFLFKKRDFDNVEFAQINGHFDVANRDLDIDRMRVESSVLTLYLEGKYSLDAKTDLTIQIPLSNLKSRDKNYKPQEVAEDGKVGPSVFLRARTDEKGQTAISYDPFNKRRKKKSKG
jgi:hypothetical protein